MTGAVLTPADLRWIYNEVIDLLIDQDMYDDPQSVRCANKCRDILDKLSEAS
jgi:hypothetical protein